jgi:uncharacterized repeat protein (TIGR01451 family)
VPPYLAYVNAQFGEAPADNRFVAVSGEDIFPDMAIGRLPVSTSAEAATVVDKILAYEQSPPGGDWNERMLLVADNQPDKDNNAGDFWDLSDDLAGNYLPAPYTAHKVYYDKYSGESLPGHPDPPRPTPPYYPTVDGTTEAITDTINDGVLLVNHIGHSNRKKWAHEEIFAMSDIPALDNGGKLPVFLEMTCLTSDFSFPDKPCIDGAFLRADGGGAVATWGCTTLGVASGHHFLDTGFLDAVFEEDVREIGRAAVAGKLNLFANSTQHLNLIDTYTIFGDPAMRLNTLFSDLSIAKAVDAPQPLRPGGTLTYTLSYANAGPATAHNVVVTDVLPAELVEPLEISSSAVITPHEGTRFVWDVPDLAAGERETITIRATVSPTATGSFSNTASIASTAREAEAAKANNATAPLASDVVPFPVGGLSYPLRSVALRGLACRVATAALAAAAFGLLIAAVSGTRRRKR